MAAPRQRSTLLQRMYPPTGLSPSQLAVNSSLIYATYPQSLYDPERGVRVNSFEDELPDVKIPYQIPPLEGSSPADLCNLDNVPVELVGLIVGFVPPHWDELDHASINQTNNPYADWARPERGGKAIDYSNTSTTLKFNKHFSVVVARFADISPTWNPKTECRRFVKYSVLLNPDGKGVPTGYPIALSQIFFVPKYRLDSEVVSKMILAYPRRMREALDHFYGQEGWEMVSIEAPRRITLSRIAELFTPGDSSGVVMDWFASQSTTRPHGSQPSPCTIPKSREQLFGSCISQVRLALHNWSTYSWDRFNQNDLKHETYADSSGLPPEICCQIFLFIINRQITDRHVAETAIKYLAAFTKDCKYNRNVAGVTPKELWQLNDAIIARGKELTHPQYVHKFIETMRTHHILGWPSQLGSSLERSIYALDYVEGTYRPSSVDHEEDEQQSE